MVQCPESCLIANHVDIIVLLIVAKFTWVFWWFGAKGAVVSHVKNFGQLLLKFVFAVFVLLLKVLYFLL